MMNDKKLTDKIKQSAENISAPDSLKPENMMKKLAQEKPAGKKKAVVFLRKHGLYFAEAAAAMVLIFAAGRHVGITEGRLLPPKADEARAQTSELPEEQTENDGQMKEMAEEQPKTRMAEHTAEDTGALPETAAQSDEAAEEGIWPVTDEKTLYEKLRVFQISNQVQGYLRDGAMVYSEAKMETAEMTVEDSASGSFTAQDVNGADFSQTNLREMGVDEGDIVKTDGEYIYILKGNSSVKIISAKGEQMTLEFSVQPELLNESVRDMYVSDGILNLITGGSISNMVESSKDVYRTETYDYAKVITYDISNPQKPKLLGCVEQEGYYHSSRKVGDYIYLFTQYQPVIGDTQEGSSIMPRINKTAISAKDIYVPEELQNTEYLVIGAVNVREPDKAAAHKAVVSGASHFYVSSESIYICNNQWKDDLGEVTGVMKFSYKDGEIRGVGVTEFSGYLNDTFSIDEYNGYLRVVVTNWADGANINSLYVYDPQMELVGKIDDIAPGETIRSARFMGDTGYFVTFRQTDPLFSVDLSDPENPKILGELKVTGFSSYLHFYGKDRLLGIGYEADAETGITNGIKLSMFDISDPSDVKELKRFVIKDAQSCPGLGNYKAIMVNPEKNLFGFVCDNNYMVFSYDDENGFTNRMTYNLSQGGQYGSYWYAFGNVRGLYIGNTFYLAEESVLRAFDMADDFTQKEKLEF